MLYGCSGEVNSGVVCGKISGDTVVMMVCEYRVGECGQCLLMLW